jgi:ribose/xylose/arabinose/galactoside ABC-type transport system permease subunit
MPGSASGDLRIEVDGLGLPLLIMSLMNVPTFYQNTARGVVLLLAVAIDHIGRARRVGR